MLTLRDCKQGRNTKVRPFASNLEYLAAMVDYVQALALERLVERRLEKATCVIPVSRPNRDPRRRPKETIAQSRPALLRACAQISARLSEDTLQTG